MNIEMIKELTLACGISGFENDAINIAKKYISSTLDVTTDSILNTYIRRKKQCDNLPTVMIDAHIDEVGFVVQSIKPNGLIKIMTIGGFSAHNLPAHRVNIKNSDGNLIPGIITSTPVHYKSANNEVATGDLFVDIGASSDKEVREFFKIDIAMSVTLDSKFEYNKDFDIMFSKAFDCRIGVAAVIEMMNNLENEDLKINLVGTLTSQEEVGTRGIKVAVNNVKPDVAIIMEGTPADDTFSQPYQMQTKLKKGPMLRHLDPTMIANPRLQKYSLDIAKKYDIPAQSAVRTGGGTNGSVTHISNLGIPTIVIGVSVRYPHTSHNIISYSDYINTVKLTTQILKSLDKSIIEKF